MGAERLLEEAKMYEQQLIEKRRYLHQHAETEFDLHDTVAFVKAELQSMGYEPQECGKAGLIVNSGGKKSGKVFLIRGDMDALPMAEQAEVDFPSETGKMHACGHDMHTTMMLGAAKLLKEHEDEIEGTVKLMFQPAEEIFEGAHDMIEAGVLKNPDVDAALMIHVMAGQPFPAGTVIVSDGGISAPGADYFRIMSIGMLSGFFILIPLGKKLCMSVSKTENASTWKYVLSGTFMLCLFAVYVPVLLIGDTIQAAVMLTGLVIAVVLGILASKPKLRWLNDFIMAFSMIGGMVSSLLWTSILQ